MSKVLLMIKEIGNFKSNLVLKAAILVVIAGIVTAGFFSFSYSDDVNKGLSDNLIRLHVVANSDSEEDQALKLDVRDAILSYMREELKDSQNIEQTRHIVNDDMTAISTLASKEITAHGKEYRIDVSLGNYPFPMKSYGDVTLPSGYYQALKVIIGKGEGKNWWCVLFPPLCFVDATHGTLSESAKQDLKTALTDEEYSIITSADSDGEIPVKIRFKIVDLLQDSKIRFNGMISRIFSNEK
jgi:stage II sporulation protein R